MSDGEEPPAPPREWPIVVTLAYPIEFGKETISSLTFRRGTMGDLGSAKPGELPQYDELLLIASRLCGQPVAVLKKLDGEDGSEVTALALGFLSRCLGVGKKH